MSILLVKKKLSSAQSQKKKKKKNEAKFPYSPIGKGFQKQTKTIKDQGDVQIDAVKILKINNIK